MKKHRYHSMLQWEGNTGQGTKDYQSYERTYTVRVDGKAPLKGSADPAFRGDGQLWNPEEMLVVSLSACHMLWYLHLCAVNGITVVDYQDSASGTMTEEADGGGKFEAVILHPKVTILEVNKQLEATRLHKEAHRKCFIANSCNFPVTHQPFIIVQR